MWMPNFPPRRTASQRRVNVPSIADRQRGPTCGFEAIENIIQLFHDVDNGLSERDLLLRAMSYGAVLNTRGGRALHISAYQRLLQDYGIASAWYPFDPLVLSSALYNNHGVLAVGEAYYLKPEMYPGGGAHAFVLTNYCTDTSGRHIVGYTGIDSNLANTEVSWPRQNVERALHEGARSFGTPLLITARPANWFSKPRYYVMHGRGQLWPAYF
jgi:hypothetical protein